MQCWSDGSKGRGGGGGESVSQHCMLYNTTMCDTHTGVSTVCGTGSCVALRGVCAWFSTQQSACCWVLCSMRNSCVPEQQEPWSSQTVGAVWLFAAASSDKACYSQQHPAASVQFGAVAGCAPAGRL
jgi:hypothetical protein